MKKRVFSVVDEGSVIGYAVNASGKEVRKYGIVKKKISHGVILADGTTLRAKEMIHVWVVDRNQFQNETRRLIDRVFARHPRTGKRVIKTRILNKLASMVR